MANVIIKSSSGADITSRYDIIQSGDSITATRKVDDKMVILRDSDIISDSMHKINYNFELIENREDVNDYKLVKYSKQINDEIKNLKERVDKNNIILSNSIDRLSGEISSSGSSADIQAKVNNAIMNANSLISDMVTSLAGQQISDALGLYVKSSELTSKLEGYITSDDLGNYVTRDELPDGTVDYVSSTAFDAFKADAAKSSAAASRIVSNNKLYRIDGYLVYNSDGDEPVSHVGGQKSTYKTIEEVYDAIKNTIDPSNKGMDDPDVTNALIKFVESTFRTVASELSLFKQEVAEGVASFDIVAAVDPDQNPETGKQVAASIFGYADKDGSKLELNADQITLSADHKLKLETGTFTINSTNFKVKDNGDVVVKGDITATSLTLEGDAQTDINNLIQSGVESGIQSNNTIKNALTNLINTVGTDNGWGNNNPEIPDEYNVSWLTRAFDKTFASGGLLLTGNVFVGDSNGNITAGMMGAGSDNNDIRFFAGSGSNTVSNAPFKVYENGHLYASDAEISGNIKANKFEAQKDVTFSEENCSGTITKNTSIQGDKFIIEANGELTTVENNTTKTIDVTGNALYIKILDKLVNENNSNFDTYLYGVPVLCMRYDNKEYVLNPVSWQINATDISNMRWLEKYDVSMYSFMNPRGKSSLNGKYFSNNSTNAQQLSDLINYSGDYYMFSTDNESSFIADLNIKNKMCQFTVLDIGDPALESQKIGWMYDNGLISNDDDPLNDTTWAYTLEYNYQQNTQNPNNSLSTNIPSMYIGEAQDTTTKITEGLCQTFNGYLIENISAGLIESDSYGSTTLTGSDVTGIYNFFIDNFTSGNAEWKYNDMAVYVFGLDAGGNGNILPFGSAQNRNIHPIDSRYDIAFDMYPIINIGSYGKSVNNYNVQKMYSKCEIRFKAFYDYDQNDSSLTYDPCSPEDGDGGTIHPYMIEMKLEFGLYLDLDSVITDCSPYKSETKTKLSNKLKQFIKNFTFNNEILTDSMVKYTVKIDTNGFGEFVLSNFSNVL